MRPHFAALSLILTAAVGAATFPPAHAQTQTWSGVLGLFGSDSWAQSGNWAGSNVPNTFAETASFTDTSITATPEVLGAINVGSVVIHAGIRGYDFTGPGTLTIDQGLFVESAVPQTLGVALATRDGGTFDFQIVHDGLDGSAGTLELNDHVTLLKPTIFDTRSTQAGIEINGGLAGDADVTKRGPGRLVFDSVSPRDGLLTIEEGLVQLRQSQSLASDRPVVINGSGTLELASGVWETIGALISSTPTAAVVLGNGSRLTIGDGTLRGSGFGWFDGSIVGQGEVVKDGLGTLIIRGSHNYTGDSAVRGGMLIIDDSSGAMGQGTTFVLGGAVLAGSGRINGPVELLTGTIDLRAQFLGSTARDPEPQTLVIPELITEPGSRIVLTVDASDGTLTSDRLVVEGDADVSGASFEVLYNPLDATVPETYARITLFEIGRIFLPSNPPYFDWTLPAAPTADTAWVVDEQETQVELLLALVGDANLNGAIEQGDLDIVLNNWGLVRPSFQLNEGDLTAAVWALGDLNGNGRVEQGDLDAILNHWGGSAAPNFRGLNVPEPSAGLALLSCAALTRRRRRHIRVSRSRS